MYCSECGAKIPQDASFCGECGTKVQKSKETPPKKERKPLSKTKKISILVQISMGIYTVQTEKLFFRENQMEL